MTHARKDWRSYKTDDDYFASISTSNCDDSTNTGGPVLVIFYDNTCAVELIGSGQHRPDNDDDEFVAFPTRVIIDFTIINHIIYVCDICLEKRN